MAQGYVMVDRQTVPSSLGDLQVNFANSIDVPARIVYIHPVHNIAIIQYDVKAVGSTPVKSVELSTEYVSVFRVPC